MNAASPGGLYYVEFYDRRPGASRADFYSLATTSFQEWTRRYPQDELVANLGRTWRMGRHPYLLIWSCSGFERLDEWDETFHSTAVADLEEPLIETMTTYSAGFFRDAGPPLERPGDGPFCVETFEPHDNVHDSYRERADHAGVTVNLVIERVGRFAPEPGIAVMSLERLSDIEKLAEAVPDWVRSVGTYTVVGQEIL